MGKLMENKDRMTCTVIAIVAVLAQAFEKIIEVAVPPSQFLGLICAMVYTLLVAVCFYVLSKCKDVFMGMFASLLAFKMLPPPINYLADTGIPDAAMLYYIVQKVAFVIFAILVYKFYREQEQPRAIKPLPVLILAFAVQFFNEISATVKGFLYFKTGSMMLPYFADYAFYALAVIIPLAVAYISSKESMQFVAYFEFCALTVNIVRRAGRIGYHLVAGQHVSKSLYGWIALYAALIVVSAVMLKLGNKKEETEIQ